MLPIITFVMFQISTFKVFVVNIIFSTIYLIRVAIIHFDSMDSMEATYMVANYVCLIFGITFISAFVGYKIEKGKRDEYILKKRLET